MEMKTESICIERKDRSGNMTAPRHQVLKVMIRFGNSPPGAIVCTFYHKQRVRAKQKPPQKPGRSIYKSKHTEINRRLTSAND
jgi:hypothetical protein